MTSHRLLTIPEAAAALRTTPGSLRVLLCKRRIAFIKIGRRTLIETSEIERLVESGRVPAVVR